MPTFRSMLLEKNWHIVCIRDLFQVVPALLEKSISRTFSSSRHVCNICQNTKKEKTKLFVHRTSGSMTKTRICLSACQLINIEFEDNNFKANYTSQFSQMLLVLIVLISILDFCIFCRCIIKKWKVAQTKNRMTFAGVWTSCFPDSVDILQPRPLI